MTGVQSRYPHWISSTYSRSTSAIVTRLKTRGVIDAVRTVSDWTPVPSPSIYHSTVADVSFDSEFILSFGRGGFFHLPPLRTRAQ